MRIKVFLISFIGLFIMMLASSAFIYTQVHALRGVNLNSLTDNLYKENTGIMAWSIQSLDRSKLGKIDLPQSWAEIMIVGNKDLIILSSTNEKHNGQYIYKLPELLDQATGIIDAIKAKKSTDVSTDDYMVYLMPEDKDRSILGLKLKSWETGLISDKESQIRTDLDRGMTKLAIFLGAGTIFSVVLAVLISMVLTKSVRSVMDSFEQLSLGNFNAEIGTGKAKEIKIFYESFMRLKTSLLIALKKLGSK